MKLPKGFSTRRVRTLSLEALRKTLLEMVVGGVEGVGGVGDVKTLPRAQPKAQEVISQIVADSDTKERF